MIFRLHCRSIGRRSRVAARPAWLLLLALQILPLSSFALPKRLILCLDGIAYRDMKALQAGVTYTNIWGLRCHRQAFNHGYFPPSRMVSTFPSTSDVAWTDIFGDRPLPGYQRTYYCAAANAQIELNGITTTMEHEHQMQCQMENGFFRTMGYVYSVHVYEYEVHELMESFLNTRSAGDNFYAYIRTSDDAQHLSRDIFSMLSWLDEKLEKLRAEYRRREGRELEIVILSDHGNNHAGAGKRVLIRSFLERNGYRIATSINGPRDVVLPTVGIESWVEIHNAPVASEDLLCLLTNLAGVDLLTAPAPGRTNQFIVMNSKGERALIDWNPALNTYRYSTVGGDPLNYRPAVQALAAQGELDAAGFATADAWMAATMTRRYPLALERIVRAHTRVALNPASILISLDNAYVHANWLVKKGSELVPFGGTHGALDDLNSNGMLMSSFAPTPDTSSSRVAALFGGFPGVRNFREEEDGAEWVSGEEQALVEIPRVPFDHNYRQLPADGVFLRVWSPRFIRLAADVQVEITVWKWPRYLSAQIRRGDPQPVDRSAKRVLLNTPVSFPENCAYERVYAYPPALTLAPRREYSITGEIRDQRKVVRLFEFRFHTDNSGRPAPF